MTPALHAIRAAQHIRSWGPFAARRYTERRDVPQLMYAMALDFEQRRKTRRAA